MFQNLLEQFKNNKIDKDRFLLILSQLTDRQVMTYELLNVDIKKMKLIEPSLDYGIQTPMMK